MNKLGLFLKKNSSTILTCIGAIGVVGTAVSAAKAAPKARALLAEAEWNKQEDLTYLEKIKIAGPAYIPSAVIGASTIACIFGANVLNKRQQTALASAYALLDSSYKEYRNKVRKIFGEEGEGRVINAVAESQYSEQRVLETNDGRQLFFDFYSLQFFRSTKEEITKAVEHLNSEFETRGYVALGEFYNKLGIPNWDVDWSVGWSKGVGKFLYGYDKIEVYYRHTTMDNGESCYTVFFPFEPTEDYLN